MPSIWAKIHRAIKDGGHIHASFKELESDWTDALGRQYCAMNVDLLHSQLSASGFELLESDRIHGYGTDGVEVFWLSVLARKRN